MFWELLMSLLLQQSCMVWIKLMVKRLQCLIWVGERLMWVFWRLVGVCFRWNRWMEIQCWVGKILKRNCWHTCWSNLRRNEEVLIWVGIIWPCSNWERQRRRPSENWMVWRRRMCLCPLLRRMQVDPSIRMPRFPGVNLKEWWKHL